MTRDEYLKPITAIADRTDMTVTTSQIELLSRMLDATCLRHKVIAQNVANVNTPGYHGLDVSFEEVFSRKLQNGADAASTSVKPKIVEMPGKAERADGNNVDIDAEMGRLSKNTLLFNAYTQILANKLAVMRSAITGR
jgi:flagellar basal-body rod protein FlgB